MPLHATPTGFDITFSRGRCLVFAMLALPFAALMLLAAINTFVPILDNTPLSWMVIERRPVPLYVAMVMAGAFVGFYAVYWNSLRLMGDDLAIRVDGTGVESRSLVGRRYLEWAEVAGVWTHKSTIFLKPVGGDRRRTVPLGVFLTGVTPDDLKSALIRYRPDLFGLQGT